MKTKLFLLIITILISQITYAQQSTTDWKSWSWLIGDWVGDGNGKPGDGNGFFSLKEDLSGKVLIRKAHSEYPATADKPAIIHDDLMTVYPGTDSTSDRAIYFDNEGHVINYTVSVSDKSIVLLSEKMPSAPIFRLTYLLIENGLINIKFEMSQDGEHFMTYVEGKCKKIIN